jgi:hypothetical protein
MTLFEALETINGFSKPSKMPCNSWSIPAKDCKVGSKLVLVSGSVCNDCYALSGFYRMGNVKSCLEKRLQSLSDPRWTEAMTVAISGSEGSGFFRWFDSGDIQSLAHLEKIVQVANNLPQIKFWLPTKEYGFVQEFLSQKELPENLTIRLSGYMVDGPAPVALASRLGLVTSTVATKDFSCPANSQGNKCLSCRACWDKETTNVAYKFH